MAIKVKILEVVKHFTASSRELSVCKCTSKVLKTDDPLVQKDLVYTLTIFDPVIRGDPPVTEGEEIEVEHYQVKTYSAYKISETEAEITTNTNSITHLNDDLSRALSDLREIEQKKNDLESEIGYLERRKESLENAISDLESEKNRLIEEVRQFRAEKDILIDEHVKKLQDAVKQLCQFLPADYEEIFKIYINVRDLRRGVEKAVLIKKESDY